MPVGIGVDLVGSGAYREMFGRDGSLRIARRLRTLKDELLGIKGTRQLGEDEGDGFWILGEEGEQGTLAVQLFRRAVLIQDAWARDRESGQLEEEAPLAAKIMFGIGAAPTIEGGHASRMLDTVGRLKEGCPVGGVAFDSGMQSLVREYPRFMERTRRGRDVLRNVEVYWTIEPSTGLETATVTDANLKDSVDHLADEVGTLGAAVRTLTAQLGSVRRRVTWVEIAAYGLVAILAGGLLISLGIWLGRVGVLR